MLKKIISVLIALSVLLALSVPAFSASEKSEIDRLGAKYFKNMDLTAEYLSEVKAAVAAGDYDAAFTAYKKIICDRIVEMCDAGVYAGTLTESNLNVAKTLLESNTITLTDRSNVSETRYLGEPGAYEWIIGTDNTDGAANALLNDMNWASNLMAAWVNGEGDEYLDLWITVWEDYDTNYGTGASSEVAAVARKMEIGCLKTERKFNARIGAIYQALKYDYDAFFEKFSNESFAHMTEQIMDELLNNDAEVITVANQILAGIIVMVKNYSLYREIPEADEGYTKAGRTFKAYYENSYLKDTMDKEMSFNYNYGVIRNFYGIDTVLKALDLKPEWFDGMMEKARLRLRGIASLVMPQKMLLNIAESYSAYDPNYYINQYKDMVEEDEVVERVLNNFWGDGTKAKPAFKSIAYPYVGYYAMRESWDEDSQFIFFRGGRFASGHTDMGMLQVMYSDLGERLLIDSGPTSYGELPIGNWLVTSMAHNTISVDGYSKAWHRNQLKDFKTAVDFADPIDAVWYTSDRYDFAEGEYNFDYGNLANIWDQILAVTDVDHGRRVLMDKDNHIAVVLDEVSSEQEHEFEQTWNLAYKFNDYGLVRADREKKHWQTTLDDGLAGVEIYSFTDADIEYEVICGENDDDKIGGWYLYEYGLNIKPNVHIETKWRSKGRKNVISLINATYDNKSKIKCTESINDGYGFAARLEDGTHIAFISGESEKNEISYDGITANAKFLYLNKKTDGTVSGIMRGAANLKYNGEAVTVPNNIQDFEFEIRDGSINVIAAMGKPTTFEWKSTSKGLVPYYGNDTAARNDYVEY